MLLPMSFGAWLRQSRMMRELSLEEVATATKLPLRVVDALEKDALTDRAHALNVARACASAIGLDPDETALRLEEELPETPAPKSFWRAGPARRPAFWIVVGITVAACIAVLMARH